MCRWAHLQLYSPPVRWAAVAQLAQAVDIPVIGNGDVFEAADALRLMRTTGAAGVMIGRGSLGRPWLFRDLRDMFEGQYPQRPPSLGEVVTVATEHCELLVDHFGDELKALRCVAAHLVPRHSIIRLLGGTGIPALGGCADLLYLFYPDPKPRVRVSCCGKKRTQWGCWNEMRCSHSLNRISGLTPVVHSGLP